MNNHQTDAPIRAIISFHQADIFHGDHLILKDVSFDVQPGEFVYIIGKVGSGKTSLIKTLNCEIPLNRGLAYVTGYALHSIRKKQIPYLRRRMGIVFQDFQLLTDRSVYDNLLFVLQATGWKKKNNPAQRIADVLQMTGLSNKGYKMPHQLSGGEQQRVAIARALLNAPDIILADEPTGNLDPETSCDIMDLLVGINRAGKTVVMVTHNYNMLEKYQFRTLKCENEHVTELAIPQEVDFDTVAEE